MKFFFAIFLSNYKRCYSLCACTLGANRVDTLIYGMRIFRSKSVEIQPLLKLKIYYRTSVFACGCNYAKQMGKSRLPAKALASLESATSNHGRQRKR